MILLEHQMFDLHWTNDRCQSQTFDSPGRMIN